MLRFHLVQDRQGRWFWHLKSTNGRKVATSGEWFASAANAWRAAANVKRKVGDAALPPAPGLPAQRVRRVA